MGSILKGNGRVGEHLNVEKIKLQGTLSKKRAAWKEATDHVFSPVPGRDKRVLRKNVSTSPFLFVAPGHVALILVSCSLSLVPCLT